MYQWYSIETCMDTHTENDRPDSTNDASSDTAGRSSLLGRRSYLKTIGATAIAAGMATATAETAAADDEYDVIEVGPGETWTYELSDGEVFENYLIDITANGAEAELYARSNDWVIRNVGVTGTWDTTRRGQFIFAAVPSSDSTGRIENVYLGDGAVGDTYPNGPNGIYVPAGHAGTLEIDTVNIQGMPDNAIYGCEPGRTAEYHGTAGSMGDLIITNSYARNCRAGGFRVGTDGSRIENCVAVSCDRNIWVRFRNPTAIDCDSSDGTFGDISVGGMGWNSRESTHAALTVENCRFETTDFQESTNQIDGESSGDARRTEPADVDGVPVTATQAAAGTSAESSSESSTETDDGDDTDGHLLAFVTEPDARLARYEFSAEGTAEFTDAPYDSPSGGSIEGGTYVDEDFIEETDTGVNAGGITGGGFGDAFLVDGPITSIDIDQPDVMWVELDGEERSPEAIIEATADDEDADDEDDDEDRPEHVLIIDGTATPESVTYSVGVSGSIEPATYGEATINEDAELGDGSVEAAVDEDVDAYWFSGSFTAFRLTGNANVSVEYDAR